MPQFTLYHMGWCGFCIRVRSVASKLNIELTLVDIDQSPDARDMLRSRLGRSTVPVLGWTEDGEDKLMPESADIIAHLKRLAA
jgi:glutaredoxin 2